MWILKLIFKKGEGNDIMYMKKEIEHFTELLPITIFNKSHYLTSFYLPIDPKAKYLFVYTDKESEKFSNLAINKENKLISVSFINLAKNIVVELTDGFTGEPFAKVTKSSDVKFGLLTFYKGLNDENVYVYLNCCDIEVYNGGEVN